MAFPTPLALFLPLAFAVSDAVPRFNIEPTCKGGLDSPGLNERYSRCISEEQDARKKLESNWSRYPAGDRANCARSAGMGSGSYVELLTCLEMDADARQLKFK
ncbi:hypothetical protein [Pseudorhodoplanes sp.]|jgi:hypothetical protein|uniref:hypothetical protein n=1 Tax=Pseudorhodoplanes sp. TaxID=1934341 RepID=UPI002CED5699|nr:hypothetical protein [Pseudorhodoplanes sp.]HWV40363.1 hypothetical protein [Pseudorhodoplanes sp.]